MNKIQKRKIDVLNKAIDVLTTQKKWGRGFYGKTAKQEDILPWDKNAVCVCAVGALLIANDPKNKGKNEPNAALPPLVKEISDDMESAIDVYSIFVWNDQENRDKRQVIRAFEKTIQYIQDQP